MWDKFLKTKAHNHLYTINFLTVLKHVFNIIHTKDSTILKRHLFRFYLNYDPTDYEFINWHLYGLAQIAGKEVYL